MKRLGEDMIESREQHKGFEFISSLQEELHAWVAVQNIFLVTTCMFQSDFSFICILDTVLPPLSSLAHNGRAGMCSISVLPVDCWRTRVQLQESKLWLLEHQAVFLTTALASCQQRFNYLTAAPCSWQSPAQVPFIVPSIINKEWKAPGEPAQRCRQYQSPQKCKLCLWQWGQMCFNFNQPA